MINSTDRRELSGCWLAGAALVGAALAGCNLLVGPSATCQSDDECPADFHCAAQLCVRNDGGLAADAAPGDAAGTDAGLTDVRPPDAGGLDARQLDAARADGRRPDTAAPDHLPPDTWLLDARLPDTRLPDARLPDTRLPDTRLPDAWLPDAWLPDTRLPDTWRPDTRPPALAVVNPSFELNGSLPTGWTLYGEQCSTQIYVPPTFGIDPPVPDGTQIYGCAVNWPPHIGGVWQQVNGVRNGVAYRVQVYSYQHTTCGNMWALSRVGVDPAGGTNALAANVSWSGYASQLSAWGTLDTSFNASSGTVTLFLEFNQGGNGNNCDYDFTINYFDLVTVTPQ